MKQRTRSALAALAAALLALVPLVAEARPHPSIVFAGQRANGLWVISFDDGTQRTARYTAAGSAGDGEVTLGEVWLRSPAWVEDNDGDMFETVREAATP